MFIFYLIVFCIFNKYLNELYYKYFSKVLISFLLIFLVYDYFHKAILYHCFINLYNYI